MYKLKTFYANSHIKIVEKNINRSRSGRKVLWIKIFRKCIRLTITGFPDISFFKTFTELEKSVIIVVR